LFEQGQRRGSIRVRRRNPPWSRRHYEEADLVSGARRAYFFARPATERGPARARLQAERIVDNENGCPVFRATAQAKKRPGKRRREQRECRAAQQ
jgi:hypothetical protein